MIEFLISVAMLSVVAAAIYFVLHPQESTMTILYALAASSRSR